MQVQSTSIRYTYNSHDLRKKIVIFLGTRPEAIKCAPLIAALRAEKYKEHFNVIVFSTGQHREILKQTLGAFNQSVDIDLDVMQHNQELGGLFGTIYTGITDQLRSIKPHLVVVQGDTTTALAAALAATYQQIPVAHVEAGLRSYDLTNPYPEELNRKVIDSFARLMLAPTDFAKEALIREGACPEHVFVTGNTGIDAFFALLKKPLPVPVPSILKKIKSFKQSHKNQQNCVILVTMHRRENIEHMNELCDAVRTVVESDPGKIMIILPVHPNPNVREIVFRKLKQLPDVHIVDPISYEIFPHVITAVDIIMTDSGGIQEEGASIGKPIILMRKTTERPEGVYLGSIQQVGVEHEAIVHAVKKAIDSVKRGGPLDPKFLHLFGDGMASIRTGEIFYNFLITNKEQAVPKDCTVKNRQDSIARHIYNKDRIEHR